MKLNVDSLFFLTNDGEDLPFTPEDMTREILENFNPTDDVVNHISAHVVSHFCNDLDRRFVTVPEFGEAIQQQLDKLGYQLTSVGSQPVLLLPPKKDSETARWYWLLTEMAGYKRLLR